MKINYHTHTYRCRHAQGTEEDYVKFAISKGLNILGFSDHGPFPDDSFGMRMLYCEKESHLTEINRLQQIYSNRLEIKKGFEIEYLPMYNDYYETLFRKDKLDYLLLGEHFYSSSSGVKNICFAESTSDYIDYATSVANACRSGFFRCIAHPDLFTLNNFAWDINCEKARDIIVDAALINHVILEYNANGYRREQKDYPDGRRYQYPHKLFWTDIASTGVSVIVGSDCHNPVQVWDSSLDRAYKDLDCYGIHPVLHL